MSATPLSGTQHILRAGALEAVVASVGASLRSFTADGRHLTVAYGADEVRPSYRGATLAPWPNRVVDGAYSFSGEDMQVALTEPARGHALHGLAGWLDYEAVGSSDAHVVLRAVIQPQTGYPWRIAVTTTFELDAEGLTQTVVAENLSAAAAPWGTASHPYLVAGEGQVDDWYLELPADRVLEVTADRLIPTQLVDVDSNDPERFDFRARRHIGLTELDHAYTGLHRADGVTEVRVTDAAGRGVAIAWGDACPWVQVHTSDKPGKPGHRAGMAVEPMTCAPDAFNAARYPFDTGLIVLEPGATSSASWRIRPLG